MSYTRTYRGSISGSENSTVSYPASEHGGSKTVTIHWSESINIAVHVDTRPFDSSVDRCENRVDLLAAAVVAAEGAQAAAIAANANRTANHILNGFFGLIRSEISQRTLEYAKRCEALALKLKEAKSSCESKKVQMEQDYARIFRRYSGVFEELDRELTRRIYALDKPAFDLERETGSQSGRALLSALCATPTVYQSEESSARTGLVAAGLRRKTTEILKSAKRCLDADRFTTRNLQSILTGDDLGQARAWTAPVLYSEMDSIGGGDPTTAISADQSMPWGQPQQLTRANEWFRDTRRRWRPMTDSERARLDPYIRRVASAFLEAEPARKRIASMLLQLWEQNQPAAVQN